MKSKSFFFVVILLLIFNNSPAQENHSSLNSLINKAIELNPKLKMLEAKKNSAEKKVSINSNLPDPNLTLGIMSLPTNTFSFTQEAMTAKVIGLSQAVPFPGKLNKMAEVFNKDVEITKEELNDSRNEIINNVKQAYYDLNYIREALKISGHSKENLERIVSVVRTKYMVSEATQQNLIQADVELSKISDKIAELKGSERTNVSILNSYVLQDPETPIETEEISELDSTDLNIENLINTAKQNRPFLKGIQLEKNKSLIMENLAEYEYYPNFIFTVQYSQRDRIAETNMPLNDFISFLVGLNIPINYGGKKSAKIEESQIMQRMYDDEYDNAIQLLIKSFSEGLSKLKELKERERLNRDGLLPQAKLLLKSAMANYQVGKTDFINVLDAQNKVYEAETNLYKIKIQYYKELAKLEFLCGHSELQKSNQ